jgi:hypothetical protein
MNPIAFKGAPYKETTLQRDHPKRVLKTGSFLSPLTLLLHFCLRLGFAAAPPEVSPDFISVKKERAHSWMKLISHP